ncbi:hypothetical protein [Tenacibaculum geojense]|uniref:Uncharacterized protein n=1 Tax=Tenacibaculum geojense TaxID=915352 RepID=A0ABW3JRU7_9FLAO
MKSKKEKFTELLNSLNTELVNDEHKYIGTGNPYSDILIIGKETAFEKNSEQYKTEILGNFNFWLKEEVTNEKQLIYNEFNPRFPYKGQLLKKDNGKGNMGTSVTWMNYQKLINYIFDTPLNNNIDFHDKAFITEVNSTPSKKTINADSSSIIFRKENILNSDFFRSFKVVIISGVGYFNINEEKNEIEDIFKVKFLNLKNADNKSSQPYWIHRNKDNTILINCYQLSIGISDNLLKEIATTIKNQNILDIKND